MLPTRPSSTSAPSASSWKPTPPAPPRPPPIATDAKRIAAELTTVEEALYQTKLRANEDALNFPIRLNNKLAALLGVVESVATIAPTEQSSQAVFKELSAQLQVELDKFAAIDTKDIAAFNNMVREQNVPAITVRNGNNIGPSSIPINTEDVCGKFRSSVSYLSRRSRMHGLASRIP